MQYGRVVETGTVDKVLNKPKHPYTKALIASVPSLIPRAPRPRSEQIVLSGDKIQKTFGGGKSFFGLGKPNRFVHAVKDVTLDLRSGETLGVVGESGSGKSTLARCIIRLLDSDSGNIMLDNIDIRALNRAEMRPFRTKIQMVFQDPFASLNPRIKVGQIISQGPIIQGESRQNAEARARELLEIVGLDERAFNRYPHEFSGGQRQRVALARAIVREPNVFLMDEPLSNLDAKLRVQMRAEITRLQHKLEATTLYVTHDQVEAMTMGDRVAVMKDGVLQQIDNPSSLYEEPKNLFVAGFIGAPAMNLREAKLDSHNGGWTLQIGSTNIPLARGIVENRSSLAEYDGRNVVIGVRPEAMNDANVSSNKDLPVLSVVTELTEALGSDLLVHFPLDAKAVDAGDPDALKDLEENPLMIARVDPRSQTKPGEKIEA